MDREWNDSQPIYRQLRDRVVAMILDGVLKEGDPLPSVRNVAAEYRVNPLTVLKGYQQLVDEELVETRRGLGMFVNAGARNLLLQGERQKFLARRMAQDLRNHPAARPDTRKNCWMARARTSPVRKSKAQQTRRRSAEAMACIEARGLRKAFGTTVALDGVDLRVEEGRILGLIGPNGAGKTTALNAILGLTPYQGELKVLGRDPWTERDQLMRDVCFIADVAVLPRWMRVSQALDYVAGVHPRFDRAKAEGFLAKTTIRRTSKVRELSKGMVTQLHLALVMAIDAKLLVLDEPTLGLDILYRKQFYDSLLNDYFDRSRTIVVTTHQVEEIQHVLTDVMFINRGRIVLDCSMEEFESRYLEVMVSPEQVAAARALKPMHERQVFGRSILLFDERRSPATRRARRGAHAQHRRLVRCGDGQSGRRRHKERLDEYSIQRHARVSAESQVSRARGHVGDPAIVLVGAARIVGEPFDLFAPLAVAGVVLFGFSISSIAGIWEKPLQAQSGATSERHTTSRRV